MRIIIETGDEQVRIARDGKEERQKQVDVAEPEELTQEEAERYEAVSDLADCCEYLEEAELIKVKLLAEKCRARRERAEK